MTSNQPSLRPSIPEDPEIQIGVAQLVGYLLSDDVTLRARIATGLNQVAIPGVRNLILSAVIARARSRRACLREPAIRALEEMRPLAVECLKRELIRTRGQRTRQKLVELLGKISPSHDRQVTMVLAQVAYGDREHADVREAAREAIRRVDPEFEKYAGLAQASM